MMDRITERAFMLANSTVNTYSPDPGYLQPCPCQEQGVPQHLARDHTIYTRKGDRR